MTLSGIMRREVSMKVKTHVSAKEKDNIKKEKAGEKAAQKAKK